MPWDLMFAVILSLAPFNGPELPGVGDVPDTAATIAPVTTDDSTQTRDLATPRTPFTVDFGTTRNDYRVMAMFVLPDQSVPVSVASPTGEFDLVAAQGLSRVLGPNRWSWSAPTAPGLYPLVVRERATGQAMTLNVFVMTPYTTMRRGMIQGYRIGNYPVNRRGHEAEYVRPEGFVQVTPALEDVQVSPHFRLGQFLCKQPGGYPKYLVLRQPLLVKLEELLAEVNDRGIKASTFAIMSAYRTPSYNKAIGNVTVFSRHGYGDAADIFIDEDHDGRMDDLNHDGRHNVADARVLGNIVNATENEPEFAGLTGGMGMYAPTGAHGAFVHVDVRGFDARWGA